MVLPGSHMNKASLRALLATTAFSVPQLRATAAAAHATLGGPERVELRVGLSKGDLGGWGR